MSEEEKNVYKNLFEYPTKIITNLEIEKQQLINWLEDKIKLCDKDIKEFSKNYNVYFRIVEDTKICQRTYQDVLDYVKGDKDE